MKIVLAKTAGFCMGVRRAVNMALKAAHSGSGEHICTYGPLIHNPQTIEVLREKGIKIVRNMEEFPGGTIIIRAHGISPQERELIKRKKAKVVDATCPRVARVQGIIKRHAKKGDFIVIVGDKKHPEVLGLLGFAEGTGKMVISSPEEVEDLPRNAGRICVVAQTTQKQELFQKVVEAVRKIYPDCVVYNTICDSTRRRQEEIRRLAKEADAVIVVGGRESGNTARLAEAAASCGVPTFHIVSEEEIGTDIVKPRGTVVVSAGASTPNWVIRRVIEKVWKVSVRQGAGSGFLLTRLLDWMVKTNIYLAIGAASLCTAAAAIKGSACDLLFMIISALFVFSMHTVNQLREIATARYNYPDRADIYDKHRRAFIVAGILASCLSVFLAYFTGWWQFVFLALISFMGMIYNVKVVPQRLAGWLRYSKIRDLPMSKTILTALGWGAVISFLPILGSPWTLSFADLAVFVFVSGLIFLRTGLFDLLDIQGDMVVGKETLPVIVGESAARRILTILGLALATFMIIASFTGILEYVSIALAFCPLYLLPFIIGSERHLFSRAMHYELAVDGILVLSGIVASLYNIVYG